MNGMSMANIAKNGSVGGNLRSNLFMSPIPSSLTPFFQEYDLATLNPKRDAATIIERTLRYGTRAEVADWVQKWGRFGLPAPHLAFWRLVLGLEQSA